MAYDYWQYKPPVNALVSVTGIDGARAYPLPPNSAVPLFDANNDVLYVKTTDGAGFPTIRTFRFEEVKEPAPVPAGYITREELDRRFDEIKELINGKQPVRQPGRKQPDAGAE